MAEKACKGIDTPPTSVERSRNVIMYGNVYVMTHCHCGRAETMRLGYCSPDRRQLCARHARCREGGYAAPSGGRQSGSAEAEGSGKSHVRGPQ